MTEKDEESIDFNLPEKTIAQLQQANKLKKIVFVSGLAMLIISILTTLFTHVLPSVFLYRSTQNYTNYFVTKEKEILNEAIYNERRYWKVVGIFTVLLSIAIILVLVFGGAAALFNFIRR
jgi:magnesium-transporting ATPase (P-type)